MNRGQDSRQAMAQVAPTIRDQWPKLRFCPDCGELVIHGGFGGPSFCEYWLSRKSVSSADAAVLHKHGHPIINIWQEKPPLSGLRHADWFPRPGRPKKGHLYTDHQCGGWR